MRVTRDVQDIEVENVFNNSNQWLNIYLTGAILIFLIWHRVFAFRYYEQLENLA